MAPQRKLPEPYCQALQIYRWLKDITLANEHLSEITQWLFDEPENRYNIGLRFYLEEECSNNDEIQKAIDHMKIDKWLVAEDLIHFQIDPEILCSEVVKITDLELQFIAQHFPQVTKKEMYTYIADHILVTNQDIIDIALEPQGTPDWLKHRQGRLTGSNYGNACGVNHYDEGSPIDLVRSMLFYKEMDARGKKACKHGNTHEDLACDCYEWKKAKIHRHENDDNGELTKDEIEQVVRVEHRGLEVHPFDPWSGDSKDGIVFMQNGNEEEFLLEIKCPTKGDTYPEVPPYYYSQIQGIAYWNEFKKIDFFVFTRFKAEMYTFLVDHEYLHYFMLPRLRHWWFCMFLPNAVLVKKGWIQSRSEIKHMEMDLIVPTAPHIQNIDPAYLKHLAYGLENKKKKEWLKKRFHIEEEEEEEENPKKKPFEKPFDPFAHMFS